MRQNNSKFSNVLEILIKINIEPKLSKKNIKENYQSYYIF